MAKRGERATRCRNGHEYTAENTLLRKKRSRGRDEVYQRCRICEAESHQRLRENGYFENYLLERRYGITTAERNAILLEQGGTCALCERPAVTVDHDHDTGEVRGMLCRACNVALGVLGDDVASIQRVVNYLTRGTIEEVV